MSKELERNSNGSVVAYWTWCPVIYLETMRRNKKIIRKTALPVKIRTRYLPTSNP